MKILFKLFSIAALCGLISTAYGQSNSTYTGKQSTSLHVEVTTEKTTHIIFPAAIRYIDIGSEKLLAAKADDADNVLRVKAAIKAFPGETNFSVITDDGLFYTFDACYDEAPATASYDVKAILKDSGRQVSQDVLFEELGTHPPSLAGLLLATICKADKKNIRHIAVKAHGLTLMLKGIYSHDGKYYFHIWLDNGVNIPYSIDFIAFKIVDKKLGRRTVIQEQVLHPLRAYRPFGVLPGNSSQGNVLLLDQFTLASDKLLHIELFEKGGARHYSLEVEGTDLNSAKPISQMHLKI